MATLPSSTRSTEQLHHNPDEPAFFEYHTGSAIVPVKQELSTDQFHVNIANLLAEIAALS